MSKYFLALAVLFSVLAIGCTSVSNRPGSDQDGQVEELASNLDKQEEPKSELVCKYREGTGSRFKKKVCMTAEEWAGDSVETARNVNKLRKTVVTGQSQGR
ncbi:hypothetical protein Misp06_03257 [Microbulbifer sp. NBRC 101763]|uniref:hypothetical protein n=1 Tax=Microbulbifer TaxID=48073 RepID=UPI000382A638|nr:hypothetical protein [Microbulbifer variabilis]